MIALSMLRFVPNLLTLLNLFSGCLAVVFIFEGEPFQAIFCIALSLVFDFFDGLVARIINQMHELGRELDSLADVVSFGVAPGAMLFTMIKGLDLPLSWLPFVGFIFTLFGAYRLARFNLIRYSTDYFEGLPIPSAALYVTGLYWLANHEDCLSCASAFINPYVLGLSIILLSYLMVSSLPHFSFKLKKLGWKGMEVQWIYLLLLIPLFIIFREVAISMSIVLYVFLSLLYYTFKIKST